MHQMRDFKVGVPTPRHANSPSQEEHLALPDRAKSCSQQTSLEYTVQCTCTGMAVPSTGKFTDTAGWDGSGGETHDFPFYWRVGAKNSYNAQV